MKIKNKTLFFRGTIKNVSVNISESEKVISEITVKKSSKKEDIVVLKYKGYINNWEVDEERGFIIDKDNYIIDFEDIPVFIVPLPFIIYFILFMVKTVCCIIKLLFLVALLLLTFGALYYGHEDSDYLLSFVSLSLVSFDIITDPENIYYLLPGIGIFAWAYISSFQTMHKKIKEKQIVFSQVKGLSLWSKIKMTYTKIEI